jgi:pimeloyl-ACP methyl ester carboxylesterase
MKKLLSLVCLLTLSFISNANSQKPLDAGEHFADINGVKMHYYVGGSGPVCLFPTPGWGPSIEVYKSSLKSFEKYFTMVWYDTRMSGQSVGPEDPTKYSSLDFMNDMDSLRSYLNQPKVWIMGHSMGGFQVLNYGIHHNDKLNGIVAFSAFAGADSLYNAEYYNMIMKRQDQPYFEKGANMLLGRDTTMYSLNEGMQYIFPFYFHDVNKIEDFIQLGDPTLSEKATTYTVASGFGTEYLFTQLNKINVPTLIVVGDDDFICDKVSQSDRITKAIANSQEIVIKDAGHFTWVEQPTQFFAEVEAWLKRNL